MSLHGTRIQSTTSDLQLLGASSSVDGLSAGDDNRVHVVMRDAAGSGFTQNLYSDSLGNLGTGNRLEFVGSPTAFDATNEGIEPPPPAEFFESGD